MKDEAMTDTDAPEWPDPADKAHAVEQAKRLRNQVAEGGLRFEAYLPPSLALWLLDLIEQDTFLDPSEAVFVILGEHKSPTHNSSFAIRRVMRLMEAMMSQASAEATDASQSLARRRHRLSHAMVRSTTQRRGRTTKRWASERRTISMARWSICAIAAASFCPA